MPKSEKTLFLFKLLKHDKQQQTSCVANNFCVKSLCYNKSIVQVFSASYHVQCQLSGCPSSPAAISILGTLLGALTGVTRYVGTPQATNQRPTTQHDTKTTSSSAGIFRYKHLRPSRKQSIRFWAIYL